MRKIRIMVFCAAHLVNLNLVESKNVENKNVGIKMSKVKMSKIKNVENKNIENYKCRNIILNYSAVFCLNRKDSCPVLLVSALLLL